MCLALVMIGLMVGAAGYVLWIDSYSFSCVVSENGPGKLCFTATELLLRAAPGSLRESQRISGSWIMGIGLIAVASPLAIIAQKKIR